ncbi:MAG: helix-turn-helix transcriptional regulator [Synechococcales cyanobacterium M58_A2018_015]|nr:helix-turn-helix transcriptional regulator [Synechococcales cyanobacterium M58_A2018_015]
MNVSLSFRDSQQIATDFQQKVGGSLQVHPPEILASLPKQVGQGYFRNLRLRDGLELVIYDLDLHQSLVADFQQSSVINSLIKLTFCTSGQCSGSIPGLKSQLTVSAWQTALTASPGAAGILELRAGQTISVVEFLISPAFMMRLIEPYWQSLPPNWQHTLNQDLTDPYLHLSQTTPEIAQILRLIVQCPYQGLIRQLYLEGKALELIALYFAQFAHSPANSPSVTVRRQDFDALYQAQQILQKNMHDPPALAELAQQVGLNERKLQQGFQQLFGTTVFGLLHDYRMEQARQLIESNQMTIGAIAHAVGIAHRGYFATAFKRKFGSTPKEYLKRLGKSQQS